MKKLLSVLVFGMLFIIGCSVSVDPGPPACGPGYYWCGEGRDAVCVPDSADCCDAFGDFCSYPTVCCPGGCC